MTNEFLKKEIEEVKKEIEEIMNLAYKFYDHDIITQKDKEKLSKILDFHIEYVEDCFASEEDTGRWEKVELMFREELEKHQNNKETKLQTLKECQSKHKKFVEKLKEVGESRRWNSKKNIREKWIVIKEIEFDKLEEELA